MSQNPETFDVTEKSRVRLMRQRGSNDRKTVYEILDASFMCNVGYVIDGQPFVTPTAFWREGNHIYWHGSAASRALTSQTNIPVCVTVAHVDGIVFARSGFHSSVNYRAVMAFGKAQLVEGEEAKRNAMNIFMDRFSPGRSGTNRAVTSRELAQTKVMVMEIEEASAKVRKGGPVDDDEDYALPIWAGHVDFKTIVGVTHADPRNLPNVTLPQGIGHYEKGASLDEVLTAIYDGDRHA